MGYRCWRQRSCVGTAVSVKVRAAPSTLGSLSCVQRELHAGVRSADDVNSEEAPPSSIVSGQLEYAADERGLRCNASPQRRSRRVRLASPSRHWLSSSVDARIACARLWRLRESACIRRRNSTDIVGAETERRKRRERERDAERGDRSVLTSTDRRWSFGRSARRPISLGARLLEHWWFGMRPCEDQGER